MECIYLPELDSTTVEIAARGSEYKHLRALRLKPGDGVFVSNGKGLSALSEIAALNKSDFLLKVLIFEEEKGEPGYKLGLAMGILDKRERMEFAIEKAVEFGATGFIPLITDFSQTHKFRKERLISKAIAAMKQSKRSRLIEISDPIKLDNLAKIKNQYKEFILLDENGIKPDITSGAKDALIIAGPEGGFASEETEFLSNEFNLAKWNLGPRRLRAESAAVLGVGIYSQRILR